MRAVRCETHGEPESLTVRELPEPVAGTGQAVVRVDAAAVNYPDALIVADRYQVSAPTPFTAGSEFAGTVLSVGPGVENVAPGDTVMGASFTGAFAEQIVVSEATLSPIPHGLSMIDAAAFGVTYRTAYHALVTIGEMRPGDWVTVLGAAGGVGTACVDIATRLGGRVIAAASSRERIEFCRRLGAVEGISYQSENLKERIKTITGSGADIVIDPVGGAHAEQAIRATAWGGRYVCVGFANGEIPRIPMNLVLLKGAILRGFEIRTLADHRPDAVAEATVELARLISEGMRPHVSEVFGLDDAPRALGLIQNRAVRGKVVIDPTM
ncbi:NADPH:quinone oxidoreductase family protein [Rhodococcus opacus]|uniref:NADPH:quinone oxidoreductase family protein n=1 Tax=Rhodococcus opacus TaxID=37919 RepID=UPI001C45B581|nr:NADPH:quinone oxidoreductase family protein [Rhodococcus opacus]MBV6756177.1 NADPH:quinone oxidoreductase family protein [Rhodococcus opacus]